MDRRLFDTLWEVYRDVDGKQPINIVSSYRSPATNAMLRRRSSGVARFSQHMLGHAMDFYIPAVPLENVRAAGLRLQRGGVGFYPTSGSPFVHLDTGSIRHWPRMTHDQLARVFPDGRTVHVPSDGNPLKGYELARADIEKRGDGDSSSGSKPGGFLAALFGGRSASEDDEEGAAPAVSEKSASASVVALAASAKSADPVPMPRAKPRFAETIQLAAADAQIIPALKSKPLAPAVAAEKSEPKPQTPADIINARGFWGDEPAAAKQASAAQIAALKAREAVGAADPQATASVSENVSKALAYAPAAASPVDRANIVAASAPIPRNTRPARNAGAAATEINTVIAKGAQGAGSVVTTSTRLSAARGNDLWMRVVMLAPSATNGMLTTVLGDTDMSLMRAYFVKPQMAINMTFTDDPLMGMSSDRFTGSATATLATTSFVLRTAALR